MSAHIFALPCSANVELTVGLLTSEPVSPLHTAGRDRVSVAIPTLFDGSCPGTSDTDWMDFVLSGSSATPTGCLALLVGDVALYLLFNLRDSSTRKLLDLARSQGRIALVYRNVTLALEERLLFQTLCRYKDKATTAASARAWFTHASQVVPGLPALCSLNLPSFMAARKHVAVLVGSEAAAKALHVTPAAVV